MNPQQHSLAGLLWVHNSYVSPRSPFKETWPINNFKTTPLSSSSKVYTANGGNASNFESVCIKCKIIEPHFKLLSTALVHAVLYFGNDSPMWQESRSAQAAHGGTQVAVTVSKAPHCLNYLYVELQSSSTRRRSLLSSTFEPESSLPDINTPALAGIYRSYGRMACRGILQ